MNLLKMKYECQNCNYVSDDIGDYRSHLEGKHSGTVHKCETCLREFIWQSSVNRHMAKNHSYGVSQSGFNVFYVGNAKILNHN